MSNSKKNESSLGKSLMKQKKKAPKHKDARFEHLVIVKEEKSKLQSIIEQNALNEFLQEAELSSKNYEAAKDIKISTKSDGQTIIIDLNSLKNQGIHIKKTIEEILKNMRIPRRPKWDEKTSGELLVQLENQAFLSWRKDLAKIEETHYDLHLTPYEKNPEVWRQLWRVIEKSDIVVQIVDGRDPLFFRCTDLEQYVKEVDPFKKNILLINKADLLNEQIRKHWSEYFIKHKINHIFFSAIEEQAKINIDEIEKKLEEQNFESYDNTSKIATRDILLQTLKSLVLKIKELKIKKEQDASNPHPELITLGMVGYPNVGKSSIINVLCKKKLVGVGARPGKTKHFQTIFIEKDLMLCDCPGLVFPSCSSTKSEMVCNGVLPIDNLKDYMSPIEVLAAKIHKSVFEKLYHIKIEGEKVSASQILSAYALQRGFYTGGSGLPDHSKVSRIILKDVVSGKLLLCRLSPEYNEAKEGKIYLSNELLEKEIEEKEKKLKEQNENSKETEIIDEEEKRKGIDKEFFKEKIDEIDLNEHEIELLLQGKTVKGIRLTKPIRRDIKHAIKRGEHVEMNKFTNTKKKTNDLQIMGKHGEVNYYKNIFAKMAENNKNKENENDFEDIEDDE